LILCQISIIVVHSHFGGYAGMAFFEDVILNDSNWCVYAMYFRNTGHY